MGFVIEAPIPRHITGIYVFTVVNLLAMLCISRVDAEIIVKDLLSNETAAQYPDLQAKFGPKFPSNGLEGRLLYADPDPQACGSIKSPPSTENKHLWILLIARGGSCQFSDKVLNAQQHNYSAVIVHNFEHKDGRVPMGGGNNGSKVTIPSTFVGWKDGMELQKLYSFYTHEEYVIRILEDESGDYTGYLWPFLLVMAICILMVMVFLLLKFLRDYTNRRLSRLSNKHLKKIPIRKFKKGDYYDTCAICLDEYEEGEKIRVLPCDHVYHRKCIDPWLTKNKKTCPVCKRRVIPGRDADSESGSEAEVGGAAGGGSEITPLLSGRTMPPRSHQSLDRVTGTTAAAPLHTGPPVMPSVPDVENGAVGGVGISDMAYGHHAPLAHLVTGSGNIQDTGERRGARPDRKRKKPDRDKGTRRDEDVARHRGEEAEGTSETRGHRERRKRRKEKKRGEPRSGLQEDNEVGREREKSKIRSEKNDNGKDNPKSADPQVQGSEADQARVDKENEEESYVNAEFSGSYETEAMVAARRRGMNEVV